MENLNHALNIIAAYSSKKITHDHVKSCGRNAHCTPLAYIAQQMEKINGWSNFADAKTIAEWCLIGDMPLPTTHKSAVIYDKLVGLTENKKLIGNLELLRDYYTA